MTVMAGYYGVGVRRSPALWDAFDYPIGPGLPAGYTSRWGTGFDPSIQAEAIPGSVSGQELNLALTGGSRIAVSFDLIEEVAPDAADLEVLVGGYVHGIDGVFFGPVLRGSGDLGTRTGYGALLNTPGGNERLMLYRALSGSDGQLVNTPFNYATDTRYWLRFRVAGSNLMAKIWDKADPEPGGWMVTTTDTNITSAGRVMMMANSSGGCVYDWISVSLDDEPAPMPA